MQSVLLVATSQSVIDRVHTALAAPDITVIDHSDPETAATTALTEGVSAIIVEMRVGSMGAFALTRAVRAVAGENATIPVTILLDREADAFLAGRSGAANWLMKDSPASQLRAAVSPST